MLLFCAVCTVSMTFAQEAKKKKDSVTFFIEAMVVITVSRRSRKISLSRKSDRLEM